MSKQLQYIIFTFVVVFLMVSPAAWLLIKKSQAHTPTDTIQHWQEPSGVIRIATVMRDSESDTEHDVDFKLFGMGETLIIPIGKAGDQIILLKITQSTVGMREWAESEVE